MALEVEAYSRLRTTETIIQNGDEVWGTWSMPPFLTKPVDEVPHRVVQVTHSQEGRPDRLSLVHYGTTKLDWAIIAFNNANAVFNWPRTGQAIRIPTAEAIMSEVL